MCFFLSTHFFQGNKSKFRPAMSQHYKKRKQGTNEKILKKPKNLTCIKSRNNLKS